MGEEKKLSKFRLRNDIIFVAVILLVCAIGLFCWFVLREPGDVVKVTIYGELYGVYSLSENITEDIVSGKAGQEHNRLVIRDGKAYVESATCPDGICVEHYPIFRSGDSIVCKPNGVVVTVITDDEDAPDIIA